MEPIKDNTYWSKYPGANAILKLWSSIWHAHKDYYNNPVAYRDSLSNFATQLLTVAPETLTEIADEISNDLVVLSMRMEEYEESYVCFSILTRDGLFSTPVKKNPINCATFTIKALQQSPNIDIILTVLGNLDDETWTALPIEMVGNMLLEASRQCVKHLNCAQIESSKCFTAMLFKLYGAFHIPESIIPHIVQFLCMLVSLDSQIAWMMVKTLLTNSKYWYFTLDALYRILEQRAASLQDVNEYSLSMVCRGAVFFTGMAMWGSLGLRELRSYWRMTLSSLLTCLDTCSPAVTVEIALSVQRLVKKHSASLHTEWNVILLILQTLKNRLDQYDSASYRTHRTDSQDEPAPAYEADWLNTTQNVLVACFGIILQHIAAGTLNTAETEFFQLISASTSIVPTKLKIDILHWKCRNYQIYLETPITSQFQEIGALISEVFMSSEQSNRVEAVQVLRQLATYNSSIVNNEVFHDFVKVVYLYVISAPLHDASYAVRIEAVYLTMDVYFALYPSFAATSTDILNLVVQIITDANAPPAVQDAAVNVLINGVMSAAECMPGTHMSMILQRLVSALKLPISIESRLKILTLLSLFRGSSDFLLFLDIDTSSPPPVILYGSPVRSHSIKESYLYTIRAPSQNKVVNICRRSHVCFDEGSVKLSTAYHYLDFQKIVDGVVEEFKRSCSLIGRYSNTKDTPSINKTSLTFLNFECQSHNCTLEQMLREQAACKSQDIRRAYHAYLLASTCLMSWLRDRTIMFHVNLSELLAIGSNVFGTICSVTDILYVSLPPAATDTASHHAEQDAVWTEVSGVAQSYESLSSAAIESQSDASSSLQTSGTTGGEVSKMSAEANVKEYVLELNNLSQLLLVTLSFSELLNEESIAQLRAMVESFGVLGSSADGQKDDKMSRQPAAANYRLVRMEAWVPILDMLIGNTGLRLNSPAKNDWFRLHCRVLSRCLKIISDNVYKLPVMTLLHRSASCIWMLCKYCGSDMNMAQACAQPLILLLQLCRYWAPAASLRNVTQLADDAQALSKNFLAALVLESLARIIPGMEKTTTNLVLSAIECCQDSVLRAVLRCIVTSTSVFSTHYAEIPRKHSQLEVMWESLKNATVVWFVVGSRVIEARYVNSSVVMMCSRTCTLRKLWLTSTAQALKTPIPPPVTNSKPAAPTTSSPSALPTPEDSPTTAAKKAKRKSAPPSLLRDSGLDKKLPERQARISDTDSKRMEVEANAKQREKYILEAVVRDYYAPCCVLFDCAPGRQSLAFELSKYEQYSIAKEPFIQLCAERGPSDAMSLVRSLFVLDNSHTSQTHKIALLYRQNEGTSDDSMIKNSYCSWKFQQFMDMLGNVTSIRELRYSGGLDTSDDVSDGDYVLVHQDLSEIVIFHVPMLMLLPPSDTQRQRMPVTNLRQKLNFIRNKDVCDVWKSVGDELLRTFQRRRSLTLDESQDAVQETQLLQRKRHIGNDWVQIIFTEVTKFSVPDRSFLKHVTPTNIKSLSLGGSFGLVNIFVYYYQCSIEEFPYVHVVVRLKSGAPKEIEFLEIEQWVPWESCGAFVRSIACIADTCCRSAIGNRTDTDSPVNWIRRMQLIRNIREKYA